MRQNQCIRPYLQNVLDKRNSLDKNQTVFTGLEMWCVLIKKSSSNLKWWNTILELLLTATTGYTKI